MNKRTFFSDFVPKNLINSVKKNTYYLRKDKTDEPSCENTIQDTPG